jgi:hypothetical protein
MTVPSAIIGMMCVTPQIWSISFNISMEKSTEYRLFEPPIGDASKFRCFYVPILFLLMVSGFVSAQRTHSDNPSSVVDTAIIISPGLDTIRYTYEHFQNGAVATSKREQCTNGNWRNVSCDSFQYNAYGDVIILLQYRYLNNAWVHQQSYRYSYVRSVSGKGYRTLTEYYKDGQWVNQQKVNYTFDSVGNIVKEFAETWGVGKWENSSIVENTYDSSNDVLTTISQRWNVDYWMFLYRNSFKYEDRMMIQRTIELWNTTDWYIATRYDYQYEDTDRVVYYLVQNMESGVWVNRRQAVISYDASGNKLWMQQQFWGGEHWQDEYLYSYGYDEFGNPTSYSLERWLGSSLVPSIVPWNIRIGPLNEFTFNGAKVLLHNSQVIASRGKEENNDTPASLLLDQNYPNPFNSSTMLSFSVPGATRLTLTVYDVLGREVTRLADGEFEAGTYSRIWNAEDMASGIYFYRLHTMSFSQTKKLLLLK